MMVGFEKNVGVPLTFLFFATFIFSMLKCIDGHEEADSDFRVRRKYLKKVTHNAFVLEK